MVTMLNIYMKDFINFNNDPVYIINDQEFESILLVYGSFISIINNKRLNQIKMLLILLENKKIKECFKTISGIDNDIDLVYNLAVKFPILCKSKVVKSKLKLIVKNDRKRKSII